MTWDNIIGVDTNSPYDLVRLKNLMPSGHYSGIDFSVNQRDDWRPIPELANHRTPVKNLYCTGAAWPWGGTMNCDSGYNCYKIIAKDLGLRKPWEEKGKEEPESLIQEWRRVGKRIREEFK